MDKRLRKVPVNAWEMLPSYGNAYLYTRLIDESGRGYVAASVQEMADVLGLSRRTTKDYIRECRRDGLFRWINWNGADHVEIYYSSLPVVLAERGIEGTFAVKVSLTDLKHKKVVLAEAAAQYKQEQSLYQQKGGKKGRKQDTDTSVPSVSSFFGGRTSLNASGGNQFVKFRTKRFTFVDASTPIYGASQPAIAAVLNRSPRTVRRRLSSSYSNRLAARLNSDLKPIPKMQLAIEVGISEIADLEREENFGSTKLIQAFGRSWDPCCNLYLCDLELHGCGRLNRSIQKITARKAVGEA